MARLIDADVACKDCVRYGSDLTCEDCVVKDAQTIDAVPVVRCRECKYHEDTSVTEYEHCCLIGKTVRYNDFCSYGERKDGAD